MSLSGVHVSSIFLDAGGTRVRVWRAGRRPVVFPSTVTPEAALKRVLGSEKAAHLIAGLRGVWTAAERRSARKRLRPFAKRVEVLSDIEFAHYSAFSDGPGVALNAGTGSIAFARSRTGRTARAGGLGPLLGDEGSAFWIGREWLKATGGDVVIRAIAVRPDAVRRTAAAAHGAARAWKRGDARAKRIITAAAEHLAALVVTASERARSGKKEPVAMGGGLFRDADFRALCRDRLEKKGFKLFY